MEKLIAVFFIALALIALLSRRPAETPRPPLYQLTLVDPTPDDEPGGAILRAIIIVMVMIIIGGLAIM